MNPINDNQMELSQKLVEYAKKKGANEAQITINANTQFSVEVREGNIEKLTEAGSKAMSVKVIVDSKVATASSSDFSDTTLFKLIENAIERARLTSQDIFSGLPAKSDLKININYLKLFDEDVCNMPADKKVKLAKASKAKVRTVKNW